MIQEDLRTRLWGAMLAGAHFDDCDQSGSGSWDLDANLLAELLLYPAQPGKGPRKLSIGHARVTGSLNLAGGRCDTVLGVPGRRRPAEPPAEG
jgi:hypothetical protein